MNVVIYEKANGNIIDLVEADTQFPQGLSNAAYTYGKFEVPEGATNISACTQEPYDNRIDIIADIFDSVSSDVQLSRIMDAMDKYTTFMLALDAKNWVVARLRLAKALAASDITQVDYDLIDGKIPSN